MTCATTFAMPFDYAVHDAGWARFVWLAGADPVAWDASCIHDSLRDLALLGLHLKGGASAAHAAFFCEPGEHWLHLQAAPDSSGDLLHYQLRAYENHPSLGDDSARFALLQQGTVRRSRMVDAVCRLLDALYLQPGPAAYEAMQRLPFPAHEHRLLCSGHRHSPVYRKH